MVDAVTGSSSSSTGGIAAAAGGLNTVDFNTFLKLLTTQLQHQDPLNPMDGTEFTAQIAQFSQLEQQVATNSKLESLVSSDSYASQTLAVSYIGKEALSPDKSITLAEDGADAEFSYKLGETAASVIIEIQNSAGETVDIIEGENLPGLHAHTWDGTKLDGELAPAGEYKLRLSAVNQAGGSISDVKVLTYSKVDAVTMDGDQINLDLANGDTINFASVVSVREPGSS